MRRLAQLTPDDAQIYAVWEDQNFAHLPLSELYDPPTVALLVDISSQDPAPQPGWLASGVIRDASGRITAATFSPPPGLTVDDLALRLQNLLHAYIYAHYDQGTQASLNAVATAQQLVLLNPAATEAQKAAALGVLAPIQTAWHWVAGVLAYYYGLKAQILAGAAWESLDLDFAGFDSTDPKVALENFVTGA